MDEHAVTYESPYKFNGKEMDAETGLYCYGARYYDPSLALWYGVDALAEKYPSLGGYVYCANNPVKLIDPDGRRVFLIYYLVSDNFNVIANTRKREIENSTDFDSGKDHVYMAAFCDVSEIISMTANFMEDSRQHEYGKTVELSVYSHCGTDGPAGIKNTSEYSLSDVTGCGLDIKQMSLEGWNKIDFNFDEQSMANFYGCQSALFAEKFINSLNRKPAYSSGFGGRAGDSKDMYNFSPNPFSFFDSIDDNIYLMDNMGLVVFKKHNNKAYETNISFQIQTNIRITNSGAIEGPTQAGLRIWEQSNIQIVNE